MFFAVAVLLFRYFGLSHAATLEVGTEGAYITIQSGYDAAGNGDTVRIQTGIYNEHDICDSDISVALIGGYDGSFSTDNAYSVITGTLIVNNGIVTAGNIVINPPTLLSIRVTPTNPTIPFGTTEQFTATGIYSDNSTQNITTSVTWSSSATSIATIASSGNVTAVAAGTTTITATSGSIKGSAILTVNHALGTLVSITVTPANSSISVGTNEEFTATGTFPDNSNENITASVTWSSSAPTVATIASSGNATAVAAGTTTITATSGSGISGSTVLTVTSGGAATNVLSLTVNGSTCDSSINAGYINDPCVSVTVCAPGTSNCVTINSILLDTGSFGLRIFKQALGSISMTQVTSGSGSLAEVVQYADGSSDWGPVQMASVILGSEPAVQVPIQVIDSTFDGVTSFPSNPALNQLCNRTDLGHLYYWNGLSWNELATPDTSPSEAGFNGILGVGPLIYDCGNTCVTFTVPGTYYTCSGSTCSVTSTPLTKQVQDPVASLPTDNNGLIVQLPGVAAGGAASLTGSLVLGIGTQSNNSPSGVITYSLDQNWSFITTFNNSSYTDSFIDTGSNGLFFPSPFNAASGPYAGLLPNCTGAAFGYFCPPTTSSNPDGITNLSAVIMGASGSPTATVPFQIGNYNSLINSSNMVFGDVGAIFPNDFDWGLPFYFGRNVFIGFENPSNLGTGLYFAY